MSNLLTASSRVDEPEELGDADGVEGGEGQEKPDPEDGSQVFAAEPGHRPGCDAEEAVLVVVGGGVVDLVRGGGQHEAVVLEVGHPPWPLAVQLVCLSRAGQDRVGTEQ